jgi:predicted HAD superfamily Cof-like phosphohydrolase
VANQVPDLYGDVKKFMDLIADQHDQVITTKLLGLRWSLIDEEANEVCEALQAVRSDVHCDAHDAESIRNLSYVAKELCDLLYVTVGAFIALGLPYEEVWDLVQKSNMAKTAGHRAENGKWIKPEGWVAPYDEIEKIVKEKTVA